MSEFACDAMTIGVVVMPMAAGLALGFLLTCISVYIIHPEPKMETSEEITEKFVKRFEETIRSLKADGAALHSEADDG